MATEHETWIAHSEIYALGALDGQELKDFELHLAADCPICEASVRETRETLLALPRSLQPIDPRPNVKTRLLDSIAGEKVNPLPVHRSRPSTRWGLILGTVAAAVVGMVLTGVYYNRLYEPRHTVYTAVIDLLRDPATRDYPLYGTGPTPQARGRFLWNESGEGHIFVSDLPVAPEGKTYTVWTIARASAPTYVGTLETDAAGQGGLHIKSSPSEKPIETFAVTLEPLGTTAAPTGPIVLVSKQS